MIELKNRVEVVTAIAEAMMEHDAASTPYQEDVYLYVDENGVGRIELFQNVGGHQWVDDDHITVSILAQCESDWTGCFTTEGDIAIGLDIKYEQLIESVREWKEAADGWQYDEDEIGYNDVYSYLKEHPPLWDRITDAYEKCVRDQQEYYIERAVNDLYDALTEADREGMDIS